MNYIQSLPNQREVRTVKKFVVVSRQRKIIEIAEQGSFCGSTDLLRWDRAVTLP